MEKSGKRYHQLTRIGSKATHHSPSPLKALRRQLLSNNSDDTQLRLELNEALASDVPVAKRPAIAEAKRGGRIPRHAPENGQGNDGNNVQPGEGNQDGNQQQQGGGNQPPNEQGNQGNREEDGSNNMNQNGANQPGGNAPGGGDNPGGDDGDGGDDPEDNQDGSDEDIEEDEEEEDQLEEPQSPLPDIDDFNLDDVDMDNPYNYLDDRMYDEYDDEEYEPTESPNLSDYVDTEEQPFTRPSRGEEDSFRGAPMTTWKPPPFSSYEEPSMDVDTAFVGNASAGLFNKPRNFRGFSKNGDGAKLWIQRLEYYFKGQRLHPSQWITCAMTFLDGNAFLQMQARKKKLVGDSTWDGSWKQFATEFCTLFGAHDEEFAVRTKLTNVQCNKGNVLGYLRYFSVLVNKLTKDVPGDDDKIAWFFRGISDSDLYQSLIMDPSTGTRWTCWDSLYHYLLTRYTCVAQHKQTVRMLDNNKRKREYNSDEYYRSDGEGQRGRGRGRGRGRSSGRSRSA